MLIYVVKFGDTVNSIAVAYGISAEDIIYSNQLVFPYNLAVGQALLLFTDGTLGVSGEIQISDDSEKTSIYVGGYAYPFISRYVLEQTLPYLSDLYIFSYGFTSDGMLIPPILDDTWMITLARQYGVAPVLTLTPFGSAGHSAGSAHCGHPCRTDQHSLHYPIPSQAGISQQQPRLLPGLYCTVFEYAQVQRLCIHPGIHRRCPFSSRSF